MYIIICCFCFSSILNLEETTTMQYYAPHVSYSDQNSYLESSFPDNYSPSFVPTNQEAPPQYSLPEPAVKQEAPPQYSLPEPPVKSNVVPTILPTDMDYNEFKSAVVALGLRNRPFDLTWEQNVAQLHTALVQASQQMIDTTAISILYSLLCNQREEINFIKNALYSVMVSSLEKKDMDSKLRDKENKKPKTPVAAKKKPPPSPPTPPPKAKKAVKRPNVSALLNQYSQMSQTMQDFEPGLKKKSKKSFR